jgi:hypothetical protein
VLVTAFLLVGHASAQQASKGEIAAATPKTKLEAFERQTGTVIIRGFTTVGSVRGIYGGTASVEAREFTNATTGKQEFGIVVEVKEAGRLEREDRSYIDYDEIESLLRGIDYVVKIDSSATKLADFQADYHTKGDLTITTFSSGSDVKAAITSGRIGSVDVIITTADLQQFRNLVAAARTKLDELRKPASGS